MTDNFKKLDIEYYPLKDGRCQVVIQCDCEWLWDNIFSSEAKAHDFIKNKYEELKEIDNKLYEDLLFNKISTIHKYKRLYFGGYYNYDY